MEVPDSLTKNLNKSQREAVLKLEGPLLILAGAGSGKTRVLTHRMAALIASGRARPDEILAVTFTNKAAREMENRIHGLLSDLNCPVYSEMWVSTFHAFGARILREHIELLEYRRGFGIYDDSDQQAMIKRVLAKLGIDEKMFPAKMFASRINTAKQMALGPQEAVAKGHFLDPKSAQVYTTYEEEMRKVNSLDFGDLLYKTHELFQMYPDILQRYREQFKYVMVDEYQDTNHLQYRLVHLLCKEHHNLCVVGDEDQSIYSWRGADIRNILDFEKDFPSAKVIKLEENYRSTQTIVAAATHLISNNTERKAKQLHTSNPKGDLITLREEKTEYDEARFVAQKIKGLCEMGENSYADCAVFYRTNAQSRVIEEQLRLSGIPYQIVGGLRFYDRMEIKDVISYMKLVANPDDDIALKRVINTPTRGIGKTTVERLEEYAGRRNSSLLSCLNSAIEERIFNAGTTGKLRRFLELIEDLQKQAPEMDLVEFYHFLLDRTEYVARLKKENTAEADARIDNLEELDNALSEFSKERGEEAHLVSFLEEMALVSDIDGVDETEEKITLMTLHVSKGLEFPLVFVVGWEEGLFPSARSIDDGKDSAIEEERRLAYVGVTRAEKKLHLSYVQTRRVWGQEQSQLPSRFLKELPQELLHFETGIVGPRFMRRYQEESAYSRKAARPAKNPDMDIQSFPDEEVFDYEAQAAGAKFQKGMRVRHPTFGPGSIFQTEGSGDQQKVSVLFADNTIRKFVAKYAKLEVH